MTEPTAVLLMAYGTPATLAGVEAYYTHIRHGRPPEPAALQELVERYRAIGGGSPLLEISDAERNGLAAVLRAAGHNVRVELGMKHAQPFIEDTVRSLIADGVTRVVGLVLAPHYSSMSVGEYIKRVGDVSAGQLELEFIESWHLHPGYISMLAGRVQAAIAELPSELRARAHVLITAHSLPARILKCNDPYATQLEETARALAERAGLENWSTAWQSAGRTADEWLGPKLTDVMRRLAAQGSRAIVVCPAGFVSDHLEVLYDLDIEARALAHELGISFARTRCPNADPEFVQVLAELVSERLGINVG